MIVFLVEKTKIKQADWLGADGRGTSPLVEAFHLALKSKLLAKTVNLLLEKLGAKLGSAKLGFDQVVTYFTSATIAADDDADLTVIQGLCNLLVKTTEEDDRSQQIDYSKQAVTQGTVGVGLKLAEGDEVVLSKWRLQEERSRVLLLSFLRSLVWNKA